MWVIQTFLLVLHRMTFIQIYFNVHVYFVPTVSHLYQWLVIHYQLRKQQKSLLQTLCLLCCRLYAKFEIFSYDWTQSVQASTQYTQILCLFYSRKCLKMAIFWKGFRTKTLKESKSGLDMFSKMLCFNVKIFFFKLH